MSICQHCGKPELDHVVIWDLSNKSRTFCPMTTFTPLPEPLKAKPGVRYRLPGLVAGWPTYAVGSADGRLWVNDCRDRVPMSSDWIEVT